MNNSPRKLLISTSFEYFKLPYEKWHLTKGTRLILWDFKRPAERLRVNEEIKKPQSTQPLGWELVF